MVQHYSISYFLVQIQLIKTLDWPERKRKGTTQDTAARVKRRGREENGDKDI